MDNFIENLSPKEWESFCEVMLRQHYGVKNFFTVPDDDGGDLGLEFFTVDGTLFQCYYPESGIQMSEYKKKVQRKINADLKKLKQNEKEILKLIDEIVFNQWVLLIPEFRSKELIAYCNRKKREVIKKNISYIDEKTFVVKIETADSYPDSKLYAQGVYSKAIDIPLAKISEEDKLIWKNDNSAFSGNIKRKSNVLMGDHSERFQDKIVSKYLQIEKFLDQLRTNHPDLHLQIQDSAIAQLENIEEESFFAEELDKDFVKKIIDGNRDTFSKYSKMMSDKNVQSLSFGFLSKWLAECYMDFQ